MNDTQEKQDVIEDEPIDVPEQRVFETIPPGTYNARLVAFRTTDLPAWKLKGEEGEDKYQWEWVFEITDGEYQGTRLTDWTTRKWHEKAKAHKHAAALLGVPTLTPGVNKSTRELAGKSAQLWVTEVESKKEPGQFRNYIDKVTPTPTPRMRPVKEQDKRQREAVPRQQLAGYPSPGGDDDDIQF